MWKMLARKDYFIGTATFVRSLNGERIEREIGGPTPACARWNCARLFKVSPAVQYQDEFSEEQLTEFVIVSTSVDCETLILPARESGKAIHTGELGGFRDTTDAEEVLAAYGYKVA